MLLIVSDRFISEEKMSMKEFDRMVKFTNYKLLCIYGWYIIY